VVEVGDISVFSGLFKVTDKIICETWLSSNKSHKAVHLHVSLNRLEVLLLDVLDSEAVADNYEHLVLPDLLSFLLLNS